VRRYKVILLTIDELKTEKIEEIKHIAGEEVYLLCGDKEIPYEDIKIIITYGIEEDWELINFNELPNLEWIQIFQTGIEKVPMDEIEKRGIKLTNVRNIYGKPMSEYVMSLILYDIREIGRFIQNKQQKKYYRDRLVDEVIGKTIGIFGTGVIGKEVAKKAQVFDMNVLGFNSNARDVEYFDKVYSWDDKEHLLQKCDYIVLLLPLTDTTYHFLSRKEFQLMKESAYVINIGRGPLVEENALLSALEKREIKGAALDVFYEEPLPENSLLWEAENLIITPHLSGKTKYFFDRSIEIFQENYKLFEEEKPLKFEIDFVKGY